MKEYNILYVNDEQLDLNSLNLLLEKKYNILTAEFNEKGLKIMESQLIHLVIADQKSPQKGGVEFLKKAKIKWPKVKFIFILGFQDNQMIKEAINDFRVYGYLNHPIDENQLEHLIKNAIEDDRIEKQNAIFNKNLILFIKTAYDAIITIDKDHIIRMINPAVIKMFGYQEEELIGQNLNMLIPPDIKDHKQLIKKFNDSKQQSREMKTGNLIQGKSKSGKLITIETNLSKMESDGKIYFNAIIRDVTEKNKITKELKESEQKFRLLVTNTEEIIYILDKEGTFILSEGKGLAKLGLRAGEMVGRSVFDLYKDYPDMLYNIGRTFDGETVISEIQIEDNYFKNWYTPHLNSNEEIVGLLGLSINIGEQKHAEFTILNYQNRLKNLALELTILEEKQRRQLASDIHDEVGQLLTASRLQLAAIDFDSDSLLIKKKIKSISQTLLTAIRATREVIFNLSPPQLESIGLYAAINDWMKEEIEIKYKIRTKLVGDKMIYNIDENTRLLLFRSIKELLINIIKHARARLIQVILKGNNKSLIIVVKDDGIGFDYYRKPNKSFGLFSIQERISNLGGTMTILSKPNFGSEIKLIIPTK